MAPPPDSANVVLRVDTGMEIHSFVRVLVTMINAIEYAEEHAITYDDVSSTTERIFAFDVPTEKLTSFLMLLVRQHYRGFVDVDVYSEEQAEILNAFDKALAITVIDQAQEARKTIDDGSEIGPAALD